MTVKESGSSVDDVIEFVRVKMYQEANKETSKVTNGSWEDSYDTMMDDNALLISKETGGSVEYLKSPKEIYLITISLGKFYDRKLNATQNKANKK